MWREQQKQRCLQFILQGQYPIRHCKDFISDMGTLPLHSQMIALQIFYDLPLRPLIKAGNTRCFVVVNQRSRYVLLPCSERHASKNKIRNTTLGCGSARKVTTAMRRYVTPIGQNWLRRLSLFSYVTPDRLQWPALLETASWNFCHVFGCPECFAIFFSLSFGTFGTVIRNKEHSSTFKSNLNVD
jgi:hypothetical protein